MKHSDALVVFGVSGDLAFKKIFPALYELVKKHALNVPVIGVASTDWTRVKQAGKDFVGDQKELYMVEEEPGEDPPYERLLGDAMTGDGALFTREDAVEAAWTVVDPVLTNHPRCVLYEQGSWGPKAANSLIEADGGRKNPDPQ